MKSEHKLHSNVLNMAVIIAALGYFVDIYDLLLFAIVRQPSLKGLGITDDQQLRDVGAYLFNWQMTGMLLGGIIWGILGDKRGRLSVLFGSIFIYSAANIFNGMVHTTDMYALCRFFAGIGLAGELGAGITLVSEVMTKENRGYGTTIVSAFGISGAVAAGVVGKLFDWRTAYYIGGGLGIALLILRIGAYESGMFHQVKTEKISRGNFIQLFTNRLRFLNYLKVILIGVPIWYVIGILFIFAPEFAQVLNIAMDPETGKTLITGGDSIMYHYAGAATGALLCGLLSQYLKKRKKAILYFLLADTACAFIYMGLSGASAPLFYLFAFVFGVANGYWSVFMTIASEQFGTNIRATVTTTTPNFVRGSAVLMTSAFIYLQGVFDLDHNPKTLDYGIVYSALIVGVTVFVISIIALLRTKETYGKELDYVEPL